jgi:hypothetical protein
MLNLLVLLISLCTITNAQSVGNCVSGPVIADFDVSKVRLNTFFILCNFKTEHILNEIIGKIKILIFNYFNKTKIETN